MDNLQSTKYATKLVSTISVKICNKISVNKNLIYSFATRTVKTFLFDSCQRKDIKQINYLYLDLQYFVTIQYSSPKSCEQCDLIFTSGNVIKFNRNGKKNQKVKSYTNKIRRPLWKLIFVRPLHRARVNWHHFEINDIVQPLVQASAGLLLSWSKNREYVKISTMD